MKRWIYITLAVLLLLQPARASEFGLAEAYRLQGEHASALRLYLKAAAKGNPVASHWAGKYYFEGIGTDRNSAEAAGYFLAGARKGVEESMVYLARIYLLGDGLPKDCARAHYWIERASRGKIPAGWKTSLDACAQGF